MKGKFTAYAIGVILLSSGINWTRFMSAPSYSSGSTGSSWGSNTGSGSGNWGTSGTGHK